VRASIRIGLKNSEAGRKSIASEFNSDISSSSKGKTRPQSRISLVRTRSASRFVGGTPAIGRKATLSANRRLFVFRVRKGYVRLVFPFLQIATQFLNDALQVLNGRNFVAQWLGQLAGDAVGRYTNRLGNVAQGVFDDRFAPAFTEKQSNGGRI